MENMKNSFKAMKWYEWVMAVIMIIIAANAMIQGFAGNEIGGNPAWLTVINFISAIAGVFCVFFCAKASVSNFFFAVINTFVYMIYLWYWKIYGTFFLEALFYMPMNIVCWIAWAKHRDNIEKHLTKSRKLTQLQLFGILMIVVVSTVIYHQILVTVGGTVPWLDAATLSIGIIATILELFRFSEQYVLWIITDVIAVMMYVVHFDPVYLTKKSIYLIVAIIGLKNWIMLHNERNIQNE